MSRNYCCAQQGRKKTFQATTCCGEEPKRSHLCQAHIAKPRLHTEPNCSFHLPQQYNLNQSVWNFPVSTYEVICHTGLSTGRWGNQFIPIPSPPLYERPSILYRSWNSFLSDGWDAARFISCSTQPIRPLKCTWLNFCYLTHRTM